MAMSGVSETLVMGPAGRISLHAYTCPVIAKLPEPGDCIHDPLELDDSSHSVLSQERRLHNSEGGRNHNPPKHHLLQRVAS
jgi:hypothetical protein